MKEERDGCLELSTDLNYNAIFAMIKFFYCGKWECWFFLFCEEKENHVQNTI